VQRTSRLCQQQCCTTVCAPHHHARLRHVLCECSSAVTADAATLCNEVSGLLLCQNGHSTTSGMQHTCEIPRTHPPPSVPCVFLVLACRPEVPHGLGRKAQDRLPLHLSMTEAVRRKFDLLDQQYTSTLQQRLQQTLHYSQAGSSIAANTTGSPSSTGAWDSSHAHADAAPVVGEQLLTVTVQGRVLSKGHIETGSYIPPAEQADALKLLAGETAGMCVFLGEMHSCGCEVSLCSSLQRSVGRHILHHACCTLRVGAVAIGSS
jgi:hypothetical protein